MPIPVTLLLFTVTTSVSSVGITWRAPEPCPSESEVRRQLAATVEHERVASADVGVDAEVVAEDGGFLLRGHLTSGGRTQRIPEFLHPDCWDTLKTLQAVLIPMYMPGLAREAPALSSGGVLRVGLAFDVGALVPLGSSRGDISSGGSLTAGFQRRRLRVEFEGSLSSMRSNPAMLDMSERIELRWTYLSLQPRLCGTAFSLAGVEVRLCGGPELDILWAHRVGGSGHGGELRAIWGSMRGGAAVTVRLGRSVGLWLAVEPAVRVSPKFIETSVEGSATSKQAVLDLPRVTGRLGLGLEVSLGGPK